jgi:catechol 2,3-dioxygenase-like lactoylglutathione lyase family enzyme
MNVEALDHVNIITADLTGTAKYFADLLGLETRNGPAPLTADQAQWMFDKNGRAIIHINSIDCPRAYQRDVNVGPTGSIHHVALRCTGYDEIIDRLSAANQDHQINVIEAIGLKQIFTMDPNGVLLELNFFAD